MWPFSLFAQSSAGANLTPGQRAQLKLLKGAFYAALVAAAPLVVQVLAQQPVDLRVALYAAVPGICVAVLTALEKYFTAQGDAPLSDVVGAMLGYVQQKKLAAVGTPNEAKTPAPVAPTPAQP